jgi:hypothetical protein
MRIVSEPTFPHTGSGAMTVVNPTMFHHDQIIRLMQEWGPIPEVKSKLAMETVILEALMSVEDSFNDNLNLRHKSSRQNLLHLSCMAGMSALTKYLLSLDTDVDGRDVNGCTPLHYALLYNHKSIAIALLEGKLS